MMKILIILFKLHLRIIYFFLKLFKTNDKKILLLSRQSDSPSLDFKLIQENINKRYKDYKVVCLCRKLTRKNFIGYYFHIYKQMYYLATSKVCLIDTYIIPVSILKHKKSLTIIQLCHGVGNMKKFGYQTLDKESGKNKKISELMNMHSGYDYLISTSKLTNEFYKEAFNVTDDKLVILGSPKIDYILNIDSKKEKVLKKYPHIKDKPVILYVSTFRTYEDDYLKKFVEAAPTDKYNIIVHIHPVSYKHHPNIDEYVPEDRFYRCKDIPTVDLLSVADITITDYSSFIFECAIANKPTYLFVSDYDKYVEKNGLNVDIFKELPGIAYKEAKEMFKAIEKGNYNGNALKQFKDKQIETCDGKCTKNIVDFMIKQKAN